MVPVEQCFDPCIPYTVLVQLAQFSRENLRVPTITELQYETSFLTQLFQSFYFKLESLPTLCGTFHDDYVYISKRKIFCLKLFEYVTYIYTAV